MSNQPTIGDQIRAMRVSRGLTLRQAAELTGTSDSLISNHETGYRYPTLRTIEKYAVVYGYGVEVRLVDLVSGESLAV